MIRATTPSHVFELHTDVSNIDKMFITYVQDGGTILEKNLTEVEKGDTWVRVKLTEKETRLFGDYMPARVQVRLITKEGNIIASKVFQIQVHEVLDDHELTREGAT